jgi:hypothetical protein
MVDFYRAFASHINVPKGNWTCIMNLLKTLAWKVKLLLMIAINMLKLLKVLFFISMLILVEHFDLVKSHIKEEYCIHHRNEETRMWDRALNELG